MNTLPYPKVGACYRLTCGLGNYLQRRWLRIRTVEDSSRQSQDPWLEADHWVEKGGKIVNEGQLWSFWKTLGVYNIEVEEVGEEEQALLALIDEQHSTET